MRPNYYLQNHWLTAYHNLPPVGFHICIDRLHWQPDKAAVYSCSSSITLASFLLRCFSNAITLWSLTPRSIMESRFPQKLSYWRRFVNCQRFRCSSAIPPIKSGLCACVFGFLSYCTETKKWLCQNDWYVSILIVLALILPYLIHEKRVSRQSIKHYT